MAVTPDTNEAFLREVDDAVRQDQLLGLWQRYGRVAVAAIVAAMVAYAAYLGWQYYSAKQSGAVSESADAVVDDLNAGRTLDAKKLAALKDSGRAGYAVTAALAEAGAAAAKGDAAKAASLFGAIAGNADFPQPYRDAALVRQTALQFDTLSPQQIVDRLKPLAVAGNAWFGSAGEMTALAYMKMGKRDLAGAMFAAMTKDETVPQSIAARAQQMASVLGVDSSSISVTKIGEGEGK